MLRLALGFELRSLLRSRASLVALVAFLAIGALAIVVGQLHVTQWEAAIATAGEERDKAIEEARGYIARGETGPADRPWIDLTKAAWQDRYAGTRLAREPGPLAGVAAGAVDPAPVVFQISLYADPLAARGSRIENPQLDPGAADLAFVLGMLAPLLIGVLGLEVASRERQDQIDRLVVAQAGEVRGWLIARMVAVMTVAGSACVALCLVAGLVGGAGGAQIAALVGMVLAYVALWSGLLLAVNARAQTIRSAALAYGAVWTLLCVLLPTVAAELAISRVEADFAVAETLEARALAYDSYEQDAESVLPELYALYPELEDLPAAKERPLDKLTSRRALNVLLVAALAERHEARLSQERTAQAVSERAAYFMPVVSLGLGLERLAGMGPEVASAYRGELVAAVQDRSYWAVTKAWSKQPLGSDEFEALVAAAPPPFQPGGVPVTKQVLTLLAWALACWLAAFIGLGRAERRQLER